MQKMETDEDEGYEREGYTYERGGMYEREKGSDIMCVREGWKTDLFEK